MKTIHGFSTPLTAEVAGRYATTLRAVRFSRTSLVASSTVTPSSANPATCGFPLSSSFWTDSSDREPNSAAAALPLMLAAGAGAGSLQSIGVVVFYGVVISVLMTLIVVPVVYALVARHTGSPEDVAHRLEQLRQKFAGGGPANGTQPAE